MIDLIEKTQAKSENIKGSQPRYVLLAQQLRLQILNSELAVGDRLPSFSEFRAQHGVTLTTTEKVYSLLEQEGLIERRHGVGTFVAQPKQSFTGNIGFIGSVQPKRRHDAFTAHILGSIQQATEEQGRNLLYMESSYDPTLEAAKKTDGVLICNVEVGSLGALTKQLPENLPRVSLLIVAPEITSIVADDFAGAKLAVEHLLAAGHRRIACLMEKMPSTPRRRYSGYYDAMLAAGIEPQEDWVRLTESVRAADGIVPPYLDWGRTQMREWLKTDWPQTGCTAIIVQNEIAAVGVMQVLQEEGIQVPQQVSVIGFDGTEICDLFVPRLSAIKLPLTEIGTKGVEILTRQIAGEEVGEQVIVLPMKLRAGDSVAPPPSNNI